MGNQRGTSTTALLIVAVTVILAGGAYFTFFSSDTDDANSNAAVIDVNTNASNVNTENTNTLVIENGNSNENTNITQVIVNTNTTTNSNTNAAIVRSVDAVTVLENPSAYDGEDICITGPYQSSFEFTAFGSKLSYDMDGNLQLQRPYIWLDTSITNEETLDCRVTGVGQEFCTGDAARACGVFQVAPEGEGFGHVNAYQYQLTQETGTGGTTELQTQ